MWQGGVSLCGRIFWLWMSTWIMYLCMYPTKQNIYSILMLTWGDLRWPHQSHISIINLFPFIKSSPLIDLICYGVRRAQLLFFSLVKTSSMDRRFFRFASHPLTIKIGIFFRKMSLKILRVLCKYLLNCWKKCIFIKQHKQMRFENYLVKLWKTLNKKKLLLKGHRHTRWCFKN